MKKNNLLTYIIVAMFFIITMAGCRGGNLAEVSSDPSSPFFRKAGVDFKTYDSYIIDFENVSTNNGKGVDELKVTCRQNLVTWLNQSGIFDSEINKKGHASANKLSIKVKINVDWGSRAARPLVGMGAGTARIWINYYVYDSTSNTLVAKMETSDAMNGMGGQSWGSNAKELIIRSSEKWNKYFIENIINKGS